MDKNQDDCQTTVMTYFTNWNAYSLAISQKQADCHSIAIGSVIQQSINQIQFLKRNNLQLTQESKLDLDSPPIHLEYSPVRNSSDYDLIAIATDHLDCWKIDQEIKTMSNCFSFQHGIISFNWNKIVTQEIAIIQFDSNISLLNLEKQKIDILIRTHGDPIYDIQFSNNGSVLGFVGADGTLQQLDKRCAYHSMLLYRSKNNQPIVKMCWNQDKSYEHFIAVLQQESKTISIIDNRPNKIYSPILPIHRSCINVLQWCSNRPELLLTGDDSGFSLMWKMKQEVLQPEFCYDGRGSIWNAVCSKDLVVFSYGNSLEMIEL